MIMIIYLIVFLKNQIKLEDLQLWYSILLQAKEDLDKVTSKSDHLLMIFLRIVLFTEYPIGVNDNSIPDGQDVITINKKEKDKNLKLKKR